MTKREMENRLTELLDERYAIYIGSERRSDPTEVRNCNAAYYNGVCTAVAQIGGWERREDGTHYVKLN